MATRTKENYPLLTYNFRVTINNCWMSFSEISGLKIEHNFLIHNHGMSFQTGSVIMPGMKIPQNIIFRRGLINNSADSNSHNTANALYDWINGGKERKNITIDLLDENGNESLIWTIRNAVPVRLSIPAFNASSNEVAVEELEVLASDLVFSVHKQA